MSGKVDRDSGSVDQDSGSVDQDSVRLRRERRRYPGLWAVAGVLLGCVLTACSSNPPPTATSSNAGQFRSTDAPALLVQCMLSQGTLGPSDSVFAGNPDWLHGGSVVITPDTVTKFNAWYEANDAISVGGQDLSQWTKWAAANDAMPAAVCGPSVSAAALQKQVFGHDPAAGNPWGTA